MRSWFILRKWCNSLKVDTGKNAWSIIYLKALCSCWLTPPFIHSLPPRSVFTRLHTASLFLSPLCLSTSIFVPLPPDLHVEGLFRVPGNSLRQAALKEMLNAGADIDLETGDFHPNDVATLLKVFLGELPEPLLTHKHYHAHLKIGGVIFKKLFVVIYTHWPLY